jgi:outer membrane receptor protein involved in Fe transport
MPASIRRIGLGIASLAFATNAYADVTGVEEIGQQADEADTLFRLGRRAYEAGNFEAALADFLASYRLSPNHNVRFNIGRCFEQLARYPEAFRYYNNVLIEETDVTAKLRLQEAVARVLPYVAVVRFRSEPPGANVYVDRRDLGVRAVAPEAFALPPGAHSFVFELPGFEPAIVLPQMFAIGTPSAVTVTLRRIVGEVSVREPEGANMTLKGASGTESCVVPCTLSVAPGTYEANLHAPGVRDVQEPLVVRANRRTEFTPKLERISSLLSVTADLRDAEVFIDAKPVGVAPLTLRITSGLHQLRVIRDGYATFEREIRVLGDEPTAVAVSLQDRPLVVGTSQRSESVQDAPASVSIIRREELLAMGYPTLAEAVRGIRGLYISDDRTYASIGVRGNSPSGQYGNRIVMMLDGHPLNDNYIWSSYAGYDARVDLEDIDRIEISRGAGAVTHGAAAMYAVINLITRGRAEKDHLEASISTPESGAIRARAAAYSHWGKRSGMWASASIMNATGATFVYPEIAQLVATGERSAVNERTRTGEARGIDGWNAASLGGRIWVGDFTAQWFATSRSKQLPTGVGGTLFGASETRYGDTRGLLEARYEPRVGKNLRALVRGSLDFYDFNSTLTYAIGKPPTTENYRGRWAGAELRLTYNNRDGLSATAGIESTFHVRAAQRGQSDSQVYLLRNDPFLHVSGYASVSANLLSSLRVTAGVRASYYSLNSDAGADEILNPRVSFTWSPDPTTSAKLIFYKSFRPPSVYELHYVAPGQSAPLGLRSDQLYAAEAEITRTLGKVVIVGDVFMWSQARPIELQQTSAESRSYANAAENLLTGGIELEARRDFGLGRSVAATYSYQKSWYTGSNDRTPRNSLSHLASIKASYPLVAESLLLSSRLSIEGPRADKNDRPTDPEQASTSTTAYWDIVASGRIDGGWLRYAAGIYNIADVRGVTVPSNEYVQPTLPSTGRSLLLSVTVTR